MKWLFVALLVVLAACTAPVEPVPPDEPGETDPSEPVITPPLPPDEPLEPGEDPIDVAPSDPGQLQVGNYQAAFDLYNELAEEGNHLISPFSISTAFGMLHEGSRGNTELQLREALSYPQNKATSFNSLLEDINSNNDVTLEAANALWIAEQFPINSEFTALVENNYYAESRNVDFVGDAEGSRETINTWVEDKTNDKIEDLLPEGSVKPTTALVLTNAVYFKGDWATQFDVENTRKRDFTTENGETIQADMMHLNGESFGYREEDDREVLFLPYKGESVYMAIVLPKNELSDLDITPRDNEFSIPATQEVNVALPKFTFESTYDLKEPIQNLGASDVFAGSADLTGIGENLFVSDAFHKTFIEVNEEGTEAAGATGIVVGITSAGPLPISFVADKPFMFYIFNKETSTILFMGKVANPTA